MNSEMAYSLLSIVNIWVRSEKSYRDIKDLISIKKLGHTCICIHMCYFRNSYTPLTGKSRG